MDETVIVKFRVVRKDTKAAIAGAKIVLEHGETDGLTNGAGEAEIVTYWSGNLMYSVEAAGYTKVSGTVQVPAAGSILLAVEMGAYAAPPVPPPSGEEVIDTVGQSCDILRKNLYGNWWFRFRNRYTADGSPWSGSLSDAKRSAEGNPSCFRPPPPPPKSADDVQKDVDILRGTLQGISSRVQDLVTSITEMGHTLDAVKASIPALISTALETALAPVYAAIDALKAWITETVFELLLKNLDAGTREWRKKQI
jgi:hypothetical protein